MSETYVDLNLIFPDTSTADVFLKHMHKAIEDEGDELIFTLNSFNETQIKLDEDEKDEYMIEGLEQTDNIIDISLIYGGGELPEVLFTVLSDCGASIISLNIESEDDEDDEEPEKLFYHNGIEITKKKDIKAMLATVPKNLYTDFILLIKQCEYKKAIALFQTLDIQKIKVDNLIERFSTDIEFSEIAIPLIKVGRFDKDPELISSISDAIIYCNTGVVKEFLIRLDKTAIINNCADFLNSVVTCNTYSDTEASGFELAQWLVSWLINQGVDLNQVTEYGSVVWFGIEKLNNLPGVRFIQHHGGQSIAPVNFYDNLSIDQIIIQAAKHDDLETLKEVDFLTNRDLCETVIQLSLRYSCFNIVQWLLDNNINIDWFCSVDKFKWKNEQPEELLNFDYTKSPYYLLPFDLGTQSDDEFSSFILETVALLPNNDSPLNYLLCVFSSYHHGNNLIRRTVELGANPGSVVIYDNDDPELIYCNYPLYVAFNDSLESLYCLLELGATVPQGLENTIDLVESVKMHYEGKMKKQALKILKKHGYT